MRGIGWRGWRSAAAMVGLGLWVAACASGHRDPFRGALPQVRSVAAVEGRIFRAASTGPGLSLDRGGQVSYDDFRAPVWRVTRPATGSARYRVLMAAGIHGNEPAGVEALLRFMEALAQDPHAFPSITFHLLPVVNPWGWCHDIRHNADGIDVNRDFATFASQESRIVRDLLSGTPYDLMFDLHEDPSARGVYLYQYARPDREVCQGIVSTIRAMGYPIEQDVNMVILRTRDGIIDAPLWGLWYMRLTGQLSQTNYFRLVHSERVYTLETPTALPWEDRLRIHETAIQALLRSLPAAVPS